jgi:hypothetical protein
MTAPRLEWEDERTPRLATLEGDKPGARLEKMWATPPGLKGWLSSVDHKEIGQRYMVTALVFLLLGGLEALVMRAQLAGPERRLLTPEQYDQLFTMHGVTMIFLYASPILTGFSNYLWPLLLGSRDMAFPRLNALSYWIYLVAGLFMYAGFVVGSGPDAGWFNYVPYAAKAYNPGVNIDIYALGLILLGISTTVGAANFVVTFLRTRAPGMSVNRVPILIWGTLTASVARARVSRFCGSTCSGCSVTPGSMRSCCRRWAWFPTRCRPSAAARWSAIRPWPSRRSGPWRWGSGCGSTTCSPPACRPWRWPSSAARR